MGEIKTLVDRNWLRRFRSKAQAKRYVKGRLIISELTLLKKEKRMHDKKGNVTRKILKLLLLNLN